MKHVIMAAIDKVGARELFEDGLSADLHEHKIETMPEAFMLGRVDAIREVREVVEATFAALVKPRQAAARVLASNGTHELVKTEGGLIFRRVGSSAPLFTASFGSRGCTREPGCSQDELCDLAFMLAGQALRYHERIDSV